MQPLGRPSGIPLRRKLLFGMLALLVLYSGYAWYAGLAFTAGIETQDMDWNGDGSVSTQETLQSWYAVTVRSTKEGARGCNAFYWRGTENGEPNRFACTTPFEKPADCHQAGGPRPRGTSPRALVLNFVASPTT